MELTVRVHVFDALSSEPIANAKVAVIYGYYKVIRDEGDEPRDVFPYRLDELPPEGLHETDMQGIARVPCRFSAVSSN